MPQRPDGKAARTERVAFTRPAAERIAKVVRTVEGGNRDGQPLTFGSRAALSTSKPFRVCTYTGTWSVGDSKTVTFKNQTSTPNTASATNLFFPVTNTAAGTRDCAIARDGTAWYLIDVKMVTASASILSDVTLSASLNTSSCTVTIAKTLVTASTTFLRLE